MVRPMSPAIEHLRSGHHTVQRGQVSGGPLGSGPLAANRCNSPSLSTASSNYTATSRESSATPVHMRRMSTPRVESPRLDSYRYFIDPHHGGMGPMWRGIGGKSKQLSKFDGQSSESERCYLCEIEQNILK